MGQIRLSKQVAMEGDDYRSCHQCSIVGLHLPAQAPSATAGIKGNGKGKVTGTIADRHGVGDGVSRRGRNGNHTMRPRTAAPRSDNTR